MALMEGEDEAQSGEAISAVRQLSVEEGTLRAVIETLDVETGRAEQSVVEMPANGRGAPAAADGPGEAEAALAAASPLGLRRVLAAGEAVWALEGPADAADGTGQALRVRQDGRVEEADLAPLGLSSRRAVTELAHYEDALLIFVADAVTGFEVWSRPAGAGAAGPERLVSEGAQRFSLNAAVPAAVVVDEGVLAGTAALAHGDAEIGNWGPELILLREGGAWDLVMGQQRFSPDGLKRPASGLAQGFGRSGNAAIQAIAAAEGPEGRTVAVAVQDFAGEGVEDRRDLPPDLLDYMGPARLHVSSDLAEWREISLELPVTAGAITALAVTPEGFVVGHEGIAGETDPLTFVPRE